MYGQDPIVESFVREAKRFKLLSREEELKLARQYKKTKDKRIANLLVCSNLRFVLKCAHQYNSQNVQLSDLIQEGTLGLMKAVENFDPDKGLRLISYAVWWIKAYLQNYLVRDWSLVKMGTTQVERKLFYKLRSERAKLLSSLGRDPTPEELSQAVGEAVDDVVAMEQRLHSKDPSLDSTLAPGGDDTHLDMLEDKLPHQDSLFEEKQKVVAVRRIANKVSKTLNDREKYILKKRFFSEEPITLQEIGNKFKVSRERIRQIENGLTKKMRQAFEEEIAV